MIRLSEAFGNIGINGCSDVATSMVMQGCEPEMDIPIYGLLNLHIETGKNIGIMSNSIAEYNALQRMCRGCGAVACSLNICGVQVLNLAHAILVFTPNTGTNVFLRILNLDPDYIEMEMASSIFEVAGIPIPEFMEQSLGLLNDAIQLVFDKLIECIQGDLAEFGISLYTWDEIWDFYTMIRQSGEMNQMTQFRVAMGAPTL